MSKELGIDPKKFKHLKSDDKTTTLQHKDGHTLTIAHNVLSKKMQEQLKALGQSAKDAETEGQKQEEQDKSQYGKVIQKAQGGVVRQKVFGQEVYGTAKVEQPKPSGDSHVDDGEWPLPSQTSVGKEIQAKKDAQMKAKGGSVQKYAMGSPSGVEPLGDTGEQDVPEVPKERVEVQKIYNSLVGGMPVSPTNPNQPPTVFGPNGEPPASFDSKAWQTAEAQSQKMQIDAANASQQKAQQIQQDNEVRARAGLPPIPVPGLNTPDGVPADAKPSETEPAQASMAPAASSMNSVGDAMQNTEGMLASGYQSKLAGINAEAQAKGELGNQQADALNRNLQAQQSAQVHYQRAVDALEAERKNHIQDIQDGYVDPNKYWTGDANGNGSHSKIAAGIGMILAGFNPTNRPNAAIDFLKHQMEMNIEAQKQNLGAKQNLLTANLRQFGNLRDAQDMTRLMQSDIMQNELATAAAKAQSPMAKAAALNAAGQLKMEAAPMFQQFAMRRAITNMATSGGDPLAQSHMIAQIRVVNPEMGKAMSDAFVPGVGMSASMTTIPQEVRQEIVASNNFDKLARDYIKFAKQNSGNLSPATIAKGSAMAAELQGLYRQKSKGGVFKEGEQQFIEKLIPSNPSQFVGSLRTLPKVEELITSNHNQLNGLKRTYDLPIQQQATSQQNAQTALAWAKANPGPKADKILKMLGK